MQPAIDARTEMTLGVPALPVIPTPKRAMFPVMAAVNTLPKARKLIASTAPDETDSMKRSKSGRLRSLWTRSIVGDSGSALMTGHRAAASDPKRTGQPADRRGDQHKRK